jgi:hypothetical protein
MHNFGHYMTYFPEWNDNVMSDTRGKLPTFKLSFSTPQVKPADALLSLLLDAPPTNK